MLNKVLEHKTVTDTSTSIDIFLCVCVCVYNKHFVYVCIPGTSKKCNKHENVMKRKIAIRNAVFGLLVKTNSAED